MKTIVITGATSGFGRDLVREFLSVGDRVIATGRRLSQRSEIFERERRQFASQLIEKDLDVAVAEERSAFVDFCRSDLSGRIDVLINNAGYGLFGALEACPDQEIRRQFEVNVFGMMFVTRDLLPFLRPTRGKIFNVSSVLGFTGFPLTTSYCGSKFAVEGFSESLSYELRSHGVQVCIVEPGSYQTGFGTNTTWAEASPDSVYRRQEENYKKIRKYLNSAKPLNDPAEVPRGILKLARRERIPLRVRFGKDCRSFFWMRKLLPERLFHWSANRFFAKRIG